MPKTLELISHFCGPVAVAILRTAPIVMGPCRPLLLGLLLTASAAAQPADTPSGRQPVLEHYAALDPAGQQRWLARRFRIRVYDTFRLQRAEYARRRSAWDRA